MFIVEPSAKMGHNQVVTAFVVFDWTVARKLGPHFLTGLRHISLMYGYLLPYVCYQIIELHKFYHCINEPQALSPGER